MTKSFRSLTITFLVLATSFVYPSKLGSQQRQPNEKGVNTDFGPWESVDANPDTKVNLDPNAQYKWRRVYGEICAVNLRSTDPNDRQYFTVTIVYEHQGDSESHRENHVLHFGSLFNYGITKPCTAITEVYLSEMK